MHGTHNFKLMRVYTSLVLIPRHLPVKFYTEFTSNEFVILSANLNAVVYNIGGLEGPSVRNVAHSKHFLSSYYNLSKKIQDKPSAYRRVNPKIIQKRTVCCNYNLDEAKTI